MADDPLRPSAAHPRIPPPPGGFQAAVAGARRKRRRRAASAIGAAASLSLLVAVSVVATGADQSSLRTVDPVIGTSGTATPNPVAPDATPSALRPSSRSIAAGAPTPSGLDLLPSRTPSPTPSATPGRPGETATPMRRSSVLYSSEGDCDYTYADYMGSWCQRYSGRDRTRAGVPVEISVDICRIGTSGTATFNSTREADFEVYARDERATNQWRWSTGRRFVRQRSVVTIDGGSCLRLSTTWSTRTNRGPVIAPGVYTIRSEVDAELSGVAGTAVGVSRERSFTVTR